MGGILGLAKLLLKPAARKIAQETGVGVYKIPEIPLTTKFTELATTDNGVCADYIKTLIEKAKTPEQLKIIQEYLASNRNNIPKNTTVQLMTSTFKKMHDIATNDKYHQLAQEYLHHTSFKVSEIAHQFMEGL